MKLSREETDSLKAIELDMLIAFLKVCERLQLKYYLLGGTLLGAVRHKGFIPWDDDIDVGMPRKDYEIFKRKAQKYLPEFYFVQSRDSDPAYPYNFMKMRDSRTTFMEISTWKRNMNHGVYIDIFPLDYYPTGKRRILKFRIRQQLLKYRIRKIYEIPESMKHSMIKEFAIRMISAVAMIRYPELESALEKQEELFQSVKESEFICNFCGAWGEKEMVPLEWFAETTTVQFEGLSVQAPAKYGEYLMRLYGNYMEFPPKEKRVTHHYTKIIDLEKSYTNYMERKQ